MSHLYLGINGHVVCIDKSTGEERWKTKLKSSQLTNVCYEEGFVYAYSSGHLFCVNAQTGEQVWENPLKGLGYGYCIIATENQSAVVSSNAAAQQAAQVATTGAVVAGTSSS